MTTVIFSDVQGNYTSLERMIVVTKSFNPTTYLCLGDLVHDGNRYEENRCIDLVQKLSACMVQGNHERRLIDNPQSPARISYYNIRFIQRLPKEIMKDDLWLVHHPNRYDASRIHSIYDINGEFESLSEKNLKILLFGHSHTPLIVGRDPKKGKMHQVDLQPFLPISLNQKFTYVINPGTLGSSHTWQSFTIFDELKKTILYIPLHP